MSRGQVDLIDMQAQPDNDYKFILNYQDHFSKFCMLRPVKHKTAIAVAEILVDIFTKKYLRAPLTCIKYIYPNIDFTLCFPNFEY